MLCFQKAPSSPGGAFALRASTCWSFNSRGTTCRSGLFAEVSPHGGNRRADLFDRSVQFGRRDTQPIGPIVALGSITGIDHRRRPDAEFGRQDGSDWDETDHAGRVTRRPYSPSERSLQR